jgi:hypothetical protein
VEADKHVSLAIDTQVTVEELLEVVFSMWSVLRLYSKNNREKSQVLSVKYLGAKTN